MSSFPETAREKQICAIAECELNVQSFAPKNAAALPDSFPDSFKIISCVSSLNFNKPFVFIVVKNDHREGRWNPHFVAFCPTRDEEDEVKLILISRILRAHITSSENSRNTVRTECL